MPLELRKTVLYDETTLIEAAALPLYRCGRSPQSPSCAIMGRPRLRRRPEAEIHDVAPQLGELLTG
jgi:hypothetical protein